MEDRLTRRKRKHQLMIENQKDYILNNVENEKLFEKIGEINIFDYLWLMNITIECLAMIDC